MRVRIADMFRHLRRNPAFHAVVIVLLGLGIGANTLVFSLVDELLLKPLPVRDPRNLFLLERVSPTSVRPDPCFSERHLRDVVRKNPLVQAAVAEQPWRSGRAHAAAAGWGIPARDDTAGIAELFRRARNPRDSPAASSKNRTRCPRASPAAVLSYQFWQSQFGGNPAVIGQTLRLKNVPFVIVGVLPREFHGSDIDRAADVRLPVSGRRRSTIRRRKELSFQILLRLTPGTSRGSRRGLAAPAACRAGRPRTRPAATVASRITGTAVLEPLERGVSRLRTQFAEALWLLLGGVGLLLLAVCANVAGLLIAKAGDRRKEMGIRMALGADAVADRPATAR